MGTFDTAVVTGAQDDFLNNQFNQQSVAAGTN